MCVCVCVWNRFVSAVWVLTLSVTKLWNIHQGSLSSDFTSLNCQTSIRAVWVLTLSVSELWNRFVSPVWLTGLEAPTKCSYGSLSFESFRHWTIRFVRAVWILSLSVIELSGLSGQSEFWLFPSQNYQICQGSLSFDSITELSDLSGQSEFWVVPSLNCQICQGSLSCDSFRHWTIKQIC